MEQLELFDKIEVKELIIKGAFISPDKAYRYWLSRIWNIDKGVAGWIMLNPSTADHEIDDPTIRRCINYTKGFGYGGLVVVNLFALRSKDRSEIRKAWFPVGPENDNYIKTQMGMCDVVIAAWGNDGEYQDRGRHVYNFLNNTMCLSVTKNKQPGHPLYLKKSLPLIPYILKGA